MIQETAARELTAELRQLREQMLVQFGTADNPGTLLRALQKIEERISEHHGSLYGWQDKPGALTRLDRVEQSINTVRWIVYMIGGGVVALVADVLKRMFS